MHHRKETPPTIPAPASGPPTSEKRTTTVIGIAPPRSPWELAAISELESQIGLLRQGIACRTCLGAGHLYVVSKSHLPYAVACPGCAGQGKGRR